MLFTEREIVPRQSGGTTKELFSEDSPETEANALSIDKLTEDSLFALNLRCRDTDGEDSRSEELKSLKDTADKDNTASDTREVDKSSTNASSKENGQVLKQSDTSNLELTDAQSTNWVTSREEFAGTLDLSS